jgi:hypothetical protein
MIAAALVVLTALRLRDVERASVAALTTPAR